MIRTWLWILIVLILQGELGHPLYAAKLIPPGSMPLREGR